MTEPSEHLETLTEIRGLMERSTKFLSLSGLSGVSAGVVAVIGGVVAYLRLRTNTLTIFESEQYANGRAMISYRHLFEFLALDALAVLVGSLILVYYFTARKARRQGQTVWTASSRRLVWALLVPLAVGGLFCLGLVYHRLIWLVCPAMLTFYGLTLLNASRYTYRDLEYLGLCEIALGLISLFLTGYGLLIWIIGFGVLHIVYGTLMWYKYDRPAKGRTTEGRPTSGPVTA